MYIYSRLKIWHGKEVDETVKDRFFFETEQSDNAELLGGREEIQTEIQTKDDDLTPSIKDSHWTVIAFIATSFISISNWSIRNASQFRIDRWSDSAWSRISVNPFWIENSFQVIVIKNSYWAILFEDSCRSQDSLKDSCRWSSQVSCGNESLNSSEMLLRDPFPHPPSPVGWENNCISSTLNPILNSIKFPCWGNERNLKRKGAEAIVSIKTNFSFPIWHWKCKVATKLQ